MPILILFLLWFGGVYMLANTKEQCELYAHLNKTEYKTYLFTCYVKEDGNWKVH